MPTFHLNKMPKDKRIQMIGEFYDTIAHLKNRQEVRLFFKSLLTPDEIATLMRRIEIAVLLSAKMTYEEIAKLIGVGRNKITNVQKNLLQDDSGYKIIVKRLMEDRKNRLKKNKHNRKEPRYFDSIKKRYPAYFLLDNLLDTAFKNLEADEKELEKEALLSSPSARAQK